MNRGWMHIAILTSLIATGAAQSTRRADAGPAGWRTYRSPDYGFIMAYPADMTYYSGRPVPPPQHSMIPICVETTVACFLYQGHALDKTAVQAMGVSVNILRDGNTKEDCYIDEQPVKTISIHGTRFHVAETGGAAAGNSEEGLLYTAFHQNVCFEIALGTAYSDVGPADYKDLGIHSVNRNALRAVQSEMNRMLQSFIFAGLVRDGAAWSVHRDSSCGGMFEFPADADIKEVIPYYPEAPGSRLVTCELSFVHDDRAYTIAEKDNFRNQCEIDDWLSTSAFPGLARARKLTNGVSEYKSSDLAYFVIRGHLFILAVSDLTTQKPGAHHDRVFTHLVNSFHLP